MLRTFDSVVMQVLFEPPAFLKQQVAKALDLLHDARSFPRANVEPNPRATLYLRGLDKIGRAPRRERGQISVVAVSLKKNHPASHPPRGRPHTPKRPPPHPRPAAAPCPHRAPT